MTLDQYGFPRPGSTSVDSELISNQMSLVPSDPGRVTEQAARHIKVKPSSPSTGKFNAQVVIPVKFQYLGHRISEFPELGQSMRWRLVADGRNRVR
ncbi:hypothetical protein Q3G72_013841 [Acer saccharum]|nr:hypothetical protein Q3G72_020038 [Acer saccharum]KAK1562550.1 hypothetical protein Q3G72_013841 [Acer saccharum]